MKCFIKKTETKLKKLYPYLGKYIDIDDADTLSGKKIRLCVSKNKLELSN